jgi:hypothetical protein
MTRMGKMVQEQLSGAIIGVAMAVLNELKPGLDEVLYERAMVIERQLQECSLGLEACRPTNPKLMLLTFKADSPSVLSA